jgi:hypothetical protein
VILMMRTIIFKTGSSGQLFVEHPDGVRWSNRRAKIEDIFEFQVLFRAMDEEKVNVLLQDYRFSVDRWQELALMFQSCHPSVDSPLLTFSSIQGPVWTDKSLFVIPV